MLNRELDFKLTMWTRGPIIKCQLGGWQRDDLMKTHTHERAWLVQIAVDRIASWPSFLAAQVRGRWPKFRQGVCWLPFLTNQRRLASQPTMTLGMTVEPWPCYVQPAYHLRYPSWNLTNCYLYITCLPWSNLSFPFCIPYSMFCIKKSIHDCIFKITIC